MEAMKGDTGKSQCSAPSAVQRKEAIFIQKRSNKSNSHSQFSSARESLEPLHGLNVKKFTSLTKKKSILYQKHRQIHSYSFAPLQTTKGTQAIRVMWQVMRDDAKLADLFPWYTVKIATPVQTVESALMPIASIRYCQNVNTLQALCTVTFDLCRI